MNQFINDEIRVLGAVKALNEGISVPNLETGFIVQLNSNPKDAIQRVGRTVRKKDDNTPSDVYVLVLAGTQDEVWASKALMDFPKSKVKYYSIDEIIKKNKILN